MLSVYIKLEALENTGVCCVRASVCLFGQADTNNVPSFPEDRQKFRP